MPHPQSLPQNVTELDSHRNATALGHMTADFRVGSLYVHERVRGPRWFMCATKGISAAECLVLRRKHGNARFGEVRVRPQGGGEAMTQ